MNSTAASDSVRNHQVIAKRFCTEYPPGISRFFIGSSPSLAASIISHDYPAAGVMISINSLCDRKSNFDVGDWILDSGAFTEVARHGGYRHGVEQYFRQIKRWSVCGNLLIAVAQDWMCEPSVLKRTGLTVVEHQQLTIERYDQLMRLNPPVAVMPVLQGYWVSDYLKHLADYGARLSPGAWVGVGSVCRRNGNPEEIADILKAIKLLRSDLRLHGFGLKILALESAEVRALLYSTDSMAWSYPRKFQPVPEPEIPMAHNYQQKIAAVTNFVQKRVPKTAGAGNGQGRKPKWKSPTESVRLPKKYIPHLTQLAKEWESKEELLE